MSVFSDANDALYANPEIGIDAIYTPPGGAALPSVRVIVRAPDDAKALGGMATRLTRRTAQVRKSEIADPERDALLEIDGESFRVGDRHLDELRLNWHLDLRPV